MKLFFLQSRKMLVNWKVDSLNILVPEGLMSWNGSVVVSVHIVELFIVVLTKLETSDVCKVIDMFSVVLTYFETPDVCKELILFIVVSTKIEPFDVCKGVDRFSIINVDTVVGIVVDSCVFKFPLHVKSKKYKTKYYFSHRFGVNIKCAPMKCCFVLNFDVTISENLLQFSETCRLQVIAISPFFLVEVVVDSSVRQFEKFIFSAIVSFPLLPHPSRLHRP